MVALGAATPSAALGADPAQSLAAGTAGAGATVSTLAAGGHERRSRSLHRFGKVTVTGAFNVEGAGVNVDTIAFWRAPKTSKSLMLVSSKDRSLVEVWRYPFSSAASQRAPLRHRCLRATAGSATNGVVVDQESDLLYVASNFSRNVCVFSLPDLRHRRTIRSGAAYGLEPNLALLTLRTGSPRLYVSDDSVVHVHHARTGRKLSQFRPRRELETMWGDRARQVLYIPDEGGRSGVYAYRPDGRPYQWKGRDKLGSRRIFDSDAEGILGYSCPGRQPGPGGKGLIVVSDQIDNRAVGNDFEVFNRRTWQHLGTIKLRLPGGSGYVHNTDGIGSVRQLPPRYRGGLFTAVQDDRSVVGVKWSTIMRAISARTGRPFGCRR
jgi:myo-inositol-hexaphosphate 3-phosphohydrolase